MVLACNMLHFGGQYAGFCEAKCMVLQSVDYQTGARACGLVLREMHDLKIYRGGALSVLCAL